MAFTSVGMARGETRVMLAAKIDAIGKGAWIALTVAGFWAFWPIGLAVLMFLAFSGRLRAWKHDGPGRWYNQGNQSQGGNGVWNSGWASGWGCGARGQTRAAPSSGNAAFDAYRAETLRRLEEEQREFVEYLERLRQAKDKHEFDQFMADRTRRGATPPVDPAA